MGLTIAAIVVGALLSVMLGGFGTLLLVLGVAGVSVSIIILMATDGNPGENGYGDHPFGRSYGC
jgi:uncharacterized membrane protein YhaH (DUF805 family)